MPKQPALLRHALYATATSLCVLLTVSNAPAETPVSTQIRAALDDYNKRQMVPSGTLTTISPKSVGAALDKLGSTTQDAILFAVIRQRNGKIISGYDLITRAGRHFHPMMWNETGYVAGDGVNSPYIWQLMVKLHQSPRCQSAVSAIPYRP